MKRSSYAWTLLHIELWRAGDARTLLDEMFHRVMRGEGLVID